MSIAVCGFVGRNEIRPSTRRLPEIARWQAICDEHQWSGPVDQTEEAALPSLAAHQAEAAS